jgi:hypothetical protein
MKDNTSGPAQTLDAVKFSLLLRYSKSIITMFTIANLVIMHMELNDHYHPNDHGPVVSINAKESLTVGKADATM